LGLLRRAGKPAVGDHLSWNLKHSALLQYTQDLSRDILEYFGRTAGGEQNEIVWLVVETTADVR